MAPGDLMVQRYFKIFLLRINLWVVLKQEKLRGQVVMTDAAHQRLSESNKIDIIATSFVFI